MPVTRLYSERVRRMDVAALRNEVERLYAASKNLLEQVEEFRRTLERRVEVTALAERVEGSDARGNMLQNQRSEAGFGCEVES